MLTLIQPCVQSPENATKRFLTPSTLIAGWGYRACLFKALLLEGSRPCAWCARVRVVDLGPLDRSHVWQQ